jgi:GT2 family glycosyltransferase
VTPTVGKFSVIICAYTKDRFHDLIAAVESVQRQTCPPSEIIVVIDHNSSLLRQVQEHISDVVVVENTGVRGLSGARNSGVAIAKSPLIAFLDDDAVAAPDWLESLSVAFTDSQVLGVGGAVIPRWLNKQPSWFPEEFCWVVGCTYRGMPQTIGQIRNPIGANMAFRREVFDVVGNFRSEVGRVGTQPFGCEETELCIRARQYWPQRGFLYQPDARVFHRVPHTRGSWHYFCSRCYSEGISKAFVSRCVGVKDSLGSERTYTFRTLPQGVSHGLIDGFFHRNLGAFAKAGAIIAGLAMTVAGYFVGGFVARVSKLEGSAVVEEVSYPASEVSQPLTARTGS